ncbi:MAG: translation elongation factor Ts [Bryobacteraceae bacterium]
MAEISAQLVKQLRDLTGAGMMECKKALVEANGDFSEAQVILRKRGLATAAKKASRTAREGLIGFYLSPAADLAVLVEVNCETDFVAKTSDFQKLVEEVTQIIVDKRPSTVEELRQLPSNSEPGSTVDSRITALIAKIGENMGIPRFTIHQAKGVLGGYVHPGAKLVSVVDVLCSKPEVRDRPGFAELVNDLAMQVAASAPQFLSRNDVSPEALAKEKEIQRARALAEGKPEKIVDKVVEGRLGKFYSEVCLLDQPFIKDDSISVSQLLANKSRELGGEITVAAFLRYKVGETATAGEPAAE